MKHSVTNGILGGKVDVLVDDLLGEVDNDRLWLEQGLVVGLTVDHA